jgi:hypothetical protein
LVRLFWINHLREIRMGRSYWFECSKCGYRAKVSGRADRGLNVFVQTILCRDCRELYDAVTRLRVPDTLGGWGNFGGLRRSNLIKARARITAPPSFQAVLNRLPPTGVRRLKWLPFEIRCPVSATHRVRVWNDPDQCPKCGVYLDKSALPYRLWD